MGYYNGRLTMFFSQKRNPEEHRYYLLPGQGKGNKRKRKQQWFWSTVVGVIVAALFGWGLWFLGSR